MGIVDNIKKRMGGMVDDNYDEGYEDDGYYADNFGSYENDEADMSMGGAAPAGGVGMGTGVGGVQMGSGISISGSSGSALEMKVVKPDSFDSVAQIADHLLSKRTVVLNLENTNKETARRLIDFLSGVAYSIDGSLKKIASNAYVITPSNVDVGDAKLSRKAQAAPAPAPAQVEESADEFGDY
ncbi:MAG: cell division protein SepF [Clostridia bacterium]|nr:cell division protein SepF [Clostridia bacterium]MBR6650830.1 cell division protein SepF [Clostridia bacterium]